MKIELTKFNVDYKINILFCGTKFLHDAGSQWLIYMYTQLNYQDTRML